MRYCKFNFNADMESLEALIKEKRFENYYDGPVPTINNYIIRNIKNDIAFFIYRVEEGVLYAAFAYNERKDSYSDVWDIITGPLKNVFQIKKIQDNTEEITIYQYPEPMKEFLERNPGMSSRIAFHVDFEDYSIEELTDITKLILKKRQLSITDEAMNKLVNLYKIVYKNSDFGNGRFVRKAIEESEMNLAIRLEDCDILSESTDVLTTIEACDIPPRELLIDENSGKKTAPIGFAY